MTDMNTGTLVGMIFMALAVIGIVMSVRNKKYNVLTRKTRSIKDKAVSLKKTEKSEPKKDNTDIDELLKDLERGDENS
tara:strand:- start:1506 stop:1739 length:234 start_codon:yes stop_codon:yes gene_type:complete